MSAGIYKCNGVFAYSLNLEKKLKRKKNAEIVEVCEGEVTEEFLQKLLDKYNNITKKEDSEIEDPLKYHWKNILFLHPSHTNTALHHWHHPKTS